MPDHQRLALLNTRLEELVRQGNYELALSVATQVHDLALEHGGEDPSSRLGAILPLAGLYVLAGRHADAEPLYDRALDIQRSTTGGVRPDLLTVLLGGLIQLAKSHQSQGRPADGGRVCREVSEILRGLSDDHPYLAALCNDLASVYDDAGCYAEAARLYHRALKVFRRASGENSIEVAQCGHNLAVLYDRLGRYTEAVPLYDRALKVLRRVNGEGSPEVAECRLSLAASFVLAGRYNDAEPPLIKALEVLRRVHGEGSREVARCHHNLAIVYAQRDRYGEAEGLFRAAIEVFAQSAGGHTDLATSLNDLAGLYLSTGRYSEAEAPLVQALDVRRRALGADHPDVAESLNSLAALYMSTSRFGEAEKLLRRALEDRRRALGDDHPAFAQSLHNLALLRAAGGCHAEAEAPLAQALDIRRRALGADHPDVAESLNSLAALYAATGRHAEALDRMRQAQAVDDRVIGRAFAVSSNSQRLDFLDRFRTGLNFFLSLVSNHLTGSTEAVHAALGVVLRRKALNAESLAAQHAAALGGRYPRLRERLTRLTSVRRDIALKAFAGPAPGQSPAEHAQLLDQWTAEAERLEQELTRQIPEMDLQHRLRAADPRTVADRLPAGSALVEYVRFGVCNFGASPVLGQPVWGPARYLAFVLPAGEPGRVQLFDLGEADAIDRMVAGYLTVLSNPPDERTRGDRNASAVEAEGLELRRAVFDPPAGALGGRSRLLLAPDGELTQLAFEALPADDKGARLIDGFTISYLTTGRDVLRFGGKPAGRPAAPLVVAGPDYDLADWSSPAPDTPPAPSVSAGRRSGDHPDALPIFRELPGAREEGERISGLLGARLWPGRAALEGRLKDSKECRSPRILHLATHGFFLEVRPQAPSHSPVAIAASPQQGILAGHAGEDPLLRSGLALVQFQAGGFGSSGSWVHPK